MSYLQKLNQRKIQSSEELIKESFDLFCEYHKLTSNGIKFAYNFSELNRIKDLAKEFILERRELTSKDFL